MIIRCTNCEAAYSVDDHKVDNKRFAFNCPRCKTHNVIDNRETGEESAVGLGLDERPSMDADEGMFEKASMEIPSFEEEDEFSDGVPGIDAEAELSGIEESIDLEGAEAPESDDLLGDVDAVDELAKSGESGIEKEAAEFNLDDVTFYETSREAGEAMEGADLDIPITENIAQPDAGEDEDLDMDTILPVEDDVASGGMEMEILDAEDAELELEEGGLEEDISLEDALDSIDVSALREADEGDLATEMVGKDTEGMGIGTDAIDELRPLEREAFTEEGASIGSPSEEGVPVGIEKAIGLEHLEAESDLQKGEIGGGEILSANSDDFDESITIDLDSLDIQLGEEEVKEGIADTEVKEVAEMSDLELLEIAGDELPSLGEEDDESITIDLDSLDIPLEEEEELREGEVLDDDRLSLEDAGLTIDELEPSEIAPRRTEEHGEEDDIRLSIDEIDPELSVDELADEVEEAGVLLSEEISGDELPEVDIDRYTEEEGEIEEPIAVTRKAEAEDFLDIEQRDELEKYRGRIDREELAPSDLVPRGLINFSIDYSLKHSRIGAALRLLGLYAIRLLPRLVVAIIYYVLSLAVGILNWIIIIFTGESVEDFTEIQEKTIRNLITLNACFADVVEEVPPYAGRKDIDYSLQMDVTYPTNYSRILAFLRLSGIGILILAFPHIVLLLLLSIGSILICVAGLISIIATRRWPTILFDFMIRYYRYATNVISYLFGVVDKYPTFRFE